MISTKINDLIYTFTQKIIEENERESASKDFLESSCKILHEAAVWPSTSEQICCELTAAYNHVMMTMNCSVCHFDEVLTTFDWTTTERVIAATLKRVFECICNGANATDSTLMQESSDESINQQMMKIVKALENPVFHFKSLDVLGRLLLLVAVGCMYRIQCHGYCKDAISCFKKLTEMASVPVLKDRCLFRHGFLLAPVGLTHDDKLGEEEIEAVCVEDMICLFLVTFELPHQHLAMGHPPWKWLFTAMECRTLIHEKSFPLAMQKLQAALKACEEPHQKSCLLRLFADCYFHLGCPQLAIQTYKDGLHLDNSCVAILYELALVYRSLDLPDLELESLNLCVMAMADNRRKEKDRVPVMGVDEMIWAVNPTTPSVSYLMSKVMFAKRCLQLKRFPEAAEQYSSLVKMLQQEEHFYEFEQHENDKKLNIAEILVEASEVLLLTHQYQECLRLCDTTQPSLSADDTVVRSTQGFNNSAMDILSSSQASQSQSDFFYELHGSQFRHDDSFDPFASPNPEKKKKKKKIQNSSSADLHTSFERSRKRLRSRDMERCEDGGDGDEDDNNAEHSDDLLMTRLLLCKADALVMSAGFTDQTLACLQQAIDILLRHPISTPMETNQPFEEASYAQPPVSKRQRISSDGKAASSSQETLSVFVGTSQDVWSTHLVTTALRMAKASWERKRFPSVINSCRLVEQLDKDNQAAFYLKTLVLSENSSRKQEAIGKWLEKRGINPIADKIKLEKNIHELQQQLRPDSKNSGEKWWTLSEKEFLELDIKCLTFLLDIQSQR